METLILGGGVGGLTLALCLHRAGFMKPRRKSARWGWG